MKTMLTPAFATATVSGSEAFDLDFLPKVETIKTDSITAMRVSVFAAMVALTAVVAVL